MGKSLEVLKNKFVLAAAAGIVSVAGLAVFGDKGVLDLYHLRNERDGILSYNRSLEAENKRLEREIRLLETDKRYIGQIARKELGKLGRNEVVYKLPEQEPAPAAK